MKPTFFRTPSDFHRWLTRNHATATELLVGFYKKDSGKPSITWPESVDEALCYGWIDSIRRSIDEVSYCIRFTPRRPGSTWSAVNIRRVAVLKREGRIQPTGLKAYKARRDDKSEIYSYEQRSAELAEPYRRQLKKNRAAWEYFQSQPPSYRKIVIWWIVSATQETTRLRRLEKLAACSEKRQRLPETLPRKASEGAKPRPNALGRARRLTSTRSRTSPAARTARNWPS